MSLTSRGICQRVLAVTGKAAARRHRYPRPRLQYVEGHKVVSLLCTCDARHLLHRKYRGQGDTYVQSQQPLRPATRSCLCFTFCLTATEISGVRIHFDYFQQPPVEVIKVSIDASMVLVIGYHEYCSSTAKMLTRIGLIFTGFGNILLQSFISARLGVIGVALAFRSGSIEFEFHLIMFSYDR